MSGPPGGERAEPPEPPAWIAELVPVADRARAPLTTALPWIGAGALLLAAAGAWAGRLAPRDLPVAPWPAALLLLAAGAVLALDRDLPADRRLPAGVVTATRVFLVDLTVSALSLGLWIGLRLSGAPHTLLTAAACAGAAMVIGNLGAWLRAGLGAGARRAATALSMAVAGGVVVAGFAAGMAEGSRPPGVSWWWVVVLAVVADVEAMLAVRRERRARRRRTAA
ncbi:hypothetical protein CHIBA101_0044 [Actinomyces sp. Chiba101]|uniref:hypothetical protein n=1 Tax=Actinomyces TaxID=1654 RepID=UPI000974EA61|nr:MULTISPECIES: hypothetical protein [Actinomyces]BAW91922.1 hypothetical protein CHIBA101_0044 [Actinomyces sp. Chiba101]GAV95150.1 hypothetical protein ADENT20671_1931 [Actinomyces denticolens]SUU12618.1 Uncharacterised protein [Actinomyces denticolens]